MSARRVPGWAPRALGAVVIAAASVLVSVASPSAAGTQTNTNACLMDANGRYSNLSVTVTGTPVAISPTRIDLTNLSMGTTIPNHVFLELYSLGYYVVGFNPVGLTLSLTVAATNTVEAQRTLVTTSLMEVVISDPDGIKNTGDESVTSSPPILRPFPATSWTPTGGEIQFSQSAAAVTTNHFFGTLTATLSCVPGTTPDRVVAVPATPIPFATIVPPTPPVCLDTTVIAGKGVATDVDLTALCSDVNGNLDPASATIVTAPTGGTASVSPAGVLTYANTDPNVGSDTIVLTMADTGGLVGNPFTVTLDVRALRLMEQSGTEVTLSPVTLDGGAHVGVGALDSIMVTNVPSSGLGFTVSAYATDLGAPGVPTTTLDLDGDGSPDVSVPACAVAGAMARVCIPAANMGWVPSATVVTDDVPGGGAAVQAGGASAPSAADWLALLAGGAPPTGLSQPQVLCSAPMAWAAGTFKCDAELFLAVPASAGAATYRGLIVLTII